jgi:flagellin
MAMTINTNIAALNAQRNLGITQGMLNKSLQRLSSGLRINSAKDDAAGLAISNRMTSQIRGLNQATRNANDGISLAQTAEGAMQESTSILQRIRELSIQSANASNSAGDRSALQSEVNQLQEELTRIAENTTFNGINILDGTFSNAAFQIGDAANQTISVSISSIKSDTLGCYTIAGSNTTDNEGTGSVTGAAATAAAADHTVEAQNLTLSGNNTTATVAVADASSAEVIAAAVNAGTGGTGITATATTTAYLNTLVADGTALTLEIGTGTTLTSVTSNSLSLDDLATAIQAKSGQTGISAVYDATNNRIVLTQTAGKDIKIQNFAETGGTGNATINLGGVNDATAETLTETANDSAIVTGTVEFTSTGDFSVSSSIAESDGSVVTEALDTSPASTNSTVNQIDISDVSGANSAIAIVDGAISKIGQLRGDLGAIQNRFESTIANLQSVSENVSAARARILDADFAVETANLTKAQIMQQAGVAMLAQANQLPQIVLSLLQ